MSKRTRLPVEAPEITEGQIVQAVRELGIDVPVYRWRVVGGRMEIHAYGGAVYLWPEILNGETRRSRDAEERPSDSLRLSTSAPLRFEGDPS